nr:PhoH family protein [uncultured Anaeromusa sp.]
MQEAVAILGRQDEFLRLFRERFACRILSRGEELSANGDEAEVSRLEQLLQVLGQLYREGNPVVEHDIQYSLRMLEAGSGEALQQMFADKVVVTARGRQVRPKTIGQRIYLEAIRHHEITFGIGPAGTGKTYLAVAMAVHLLKQKVVERIVLTRPAVEAGEKLGFLPGDLQDKVDPYLRPLYDALYDLLGVETVQRYLVKQTIEIAPLAYMRGRTLEDAFIILDEAQNTTPQQMKMFLTRLGFGSKMVITGDITQIDLPRSTTSGLRQAKKVVEGLQGVAVVELNEGDVVRHELVGRIVKAYEAYEEQGRQEERGISE